jgi:diacylglycerol kinase family enzyme
VRLLLIVNSSASSVTARGRVVIQKALSADHQVTWAETNRRGHASRLAQGAANEGVDVVVCLGGDGTLNEVANGLAGTDIPVSVLPGGSTNVVARTLGIPNDVVDATEHLLGLADHFPKRRIDLGIANGRRFVFAAGAGLDASAAKRVDARPKLKARGGRWFYTGVAVASFYRDYLRNPVRMRLTIGDKSAEGITTIAQNSDPFTYFGTHPVRVCEDAAFDNGTLSIATLHRAAQRDVPTIATRVLTEGLHIPDHRQITHFTGVTEGRIESISRDDEGRPRLFPVQVDGDYIGDHGELDLSIEPGALTIVA